MHAPRWLAAVLFAILAGCSGGGSDAAPDVKVELAFQPSPPKVGAAEATVTLADAAGQPLRGAAVKLEGNMNHAGMAPSFADAKEAEPGRYKGELTFTMGGDWFVLVNATLADGRKITRKVDVRGVKR
jgi:hypothetical protein